MKKPVIYLCGLLLPLAGCKKDKPADPQIDAAPVVSPVKIAPATTTAITGISPVTGPAGTVVTITGKDLMSPGDTATVAFNDIPARIQALSATEIKAVVPLTNSGNVSVTNSHGKVIGPMFAYITVAKISSISPASGLPGTSVIISGTDFGNTMAGMQVKFNGRSATIRLVRDNVITVDAPSSATGPVELTMAGHVIPGPEFRYITLWTDSYLSGDVKLSSQAEVDAFAAQNRGRQLKITGDLSIKGTDITTLSAMPEIIGVSGSLNISDCPQLTDVSFLKNIQEGPAGILLMNLAIGSISMDRLVTTKSIFINACKQLRSASFPELATLTGDGMLLSNLTVLSCGQLSELDCSKLETAVSGVSISGSALKDLTKFSRLRTSGMLKLMGNPQLISLDGLEQLTTINGPALFPIYGGAAVNGVRIEGNGQLRSLSGLRNLKATPLLEIWANPLCADFCPLKPLIISLKDKPPFSYTAAVSSGIDSWGTRYVPALDLSSNGPYGGTQQVLDALSSCP